MKFYYDFHIHSCLSPCGDKDMTPNNIANMAKLLGFDVVALTDHNSCLNCPAAVKAGENAGLCVIPGMELSTSEDIHMVCLFENTDCALEFSDYVRKHSFNIKNKKEIYGEQEILDENDNKIGEVDDLLIMASDIGVSEAPEIVEKYGGFCYPAHIDRDSYSITSVLGDVPPENNNGVCGISFSADEEKLRKLYTLDKTVLLRSSDAHYLENMREAQSMIELETLSAGAVIEKLKAFAG